MTYKKKVKSQTHDSYMQLLRLLRKTDTFSSKSNKAELLTERVHHFFFSKRVIKALNSDTEIIVFKSSLIASTHIGQFKH